MLVAQLCLILLHPWTAAHHIPLFMGFSRQEYWSGLPFFSPGDLPHPGIEPGSLNPQLGWKGREKAETKTILSPHGSVDKESTCNAGDIGDAGSIPGSGRNGNPLQYSCLGSPMDGGAWQATVYGVAESDTTE